MTYKWIRKSFLIAISFLMVGLVFSCKGANGATNNTTTNPDPVITFEVTPSDGGEIIATVNGKSIKSGAGVKKGSEVVFTLEPKGNYTIDKWEGKEVKKDKQNDFVARLKVSESVTAKAVLKATTDPVLELKSLQIYGEDVDISNLSYVKTEVENYVQTLDSTNIVAKFKYGTVGPKKIEVNVDKKTLDEEETEVRLSVQPLAGTYRYWSQIVHVIRKPAKEPDFIQPEVRLEGIDVAILTPRKQGGKFKYEEYAPVKEFNAEASGPYMAPADAKTAYVALRAKVQKPASGNDYSIELTNTTTYIKPTKFSRGSDENASYLIINDVVLSKGTNILELKVQSPTSPTTGTYTVTVNYDGGPDPTTLPELQRNILHGVYCAAQRKPLKGEAPDYIWLISIAGW